MTNTKRQIVCEFVRPKSGSNRSNQCHKRAPSSCNNDNKCSTLLHYKQYQLTLMAIMQSVTKYKPVVLVVD